jgi:hypothetical protein
LRLHAVVTRFRAANSAAPSRYHSLRLC